MASNRPPMIPIMLLVFALPAVGFGVPAVLGARDDERLQPVEGEVLEVSSDRESLLVRSNSPNAPTHETTIAVRYAYTVDGVRYEGDRYAFDEPDELETHADAAVARLEALESSGVVQVFVDPDDPTRAVLQRRELERPLAATVIGSGLLLFSLGWLVTWFRGRQRTAPGDAAG